MEGEGKEGGRRKEEGDQMAIPHVLVIPLPAQGHVLPLMELSLVLAKHGVRITFVNAEFIHEKIVNTFMETGAEMGDQFRLVSIPDGLIEADRSNSEKLTGSVWGSTKEKLEELIETIRRSGDDVSCVLADRGMGSAPDVAGKMGIQAAAFCPFSAMFISLSLSILYMITDGIIDNDGTPTREEEMVFLNNNIPTVNGKDLPWVRYGNLTKQKHLFKLIQQNNESTKKVEWLLCNSAYDLEPAVFSSYPNITPVGPLLARNRLGESAGGLWPTDPTCLEWLDQHPPSSVLYVAFGSTTFFNEKQFQELALGLELCSVPFLWVVRPNSVGSTEAAYPEGFQERVAGRGKVVTWAPQQKVLSHPSLGCFLSHCGWNSVVEGISNGVPFLCWPYEVDHFLYARYICDVWNVGLGFKQDEDGVVTHEEIKYEVEELFGDGNFKDRVLNLQESALNSVGEGGLSYNNLQSFIQWLKEQPSQ